jgi:hypothetical protein
MIACSIPLAQNKNSIEAYNRIMNEQSKAICIACTTRLSYSDNLVRKCRQKANEVENSSLADALIKDMVSEKGAVFCPMFGMVFKEVPENCPYILEHSMNRG